MIFELQNGYELLKTNMLIFTIIIINREAANAFMEYFGDIIAWDVSDVNAAL